MKYKFRLGLLSYLVMAYMLLAFGWWSVLLHKKNKEAFKANKINLINKIKLDNRSYSESILLNNEEYQILYNKYKRQEYMILGEGLVFIISILLGMWFIYRGYRRQIETAEEKRNFLLSITHELKSPLASLKIASDTMANRTLNKDQQKLLMSNSQHDIDRLQKLVENILLAAKVDSNYEPVFNTINLTQEVLRSVDQFKAKYPKVTFDVPHMDAIYIEADQTGLVSVIYNLIENAIKYSINVPKIKISITSSIDKIKLAVADQGIGIPKEERNKVFDRFYRVGSEETRRTKGTGLGLYIVGQIAQVHKWPIKILNNTPQGTIMELTIPTIKSN